MFDAGFSQFGVFSKNSATRRQLAVLVDESDLNQASVHTANCNGPICDFKCSQFEIANWTPNGPQMVERESDFRNQLNGLSKSAR